MKQDSLPQPLRPTVVRRSLNVAELLRYRLEYRGRVAGLLKQVDPEDRVRLTWSERRKVRAYWNQFGVRFISLAWFRLFKALTGRVDPRFVPEETFRVQIEPILCRRDVALAYHDKNQSDRLFTDVERPYTLLRNIYGRYYDHEYAPVPRESVVAMLASHGGTLILKPSITGTGSGHNVASVEVTGKGFVIANTVLSLDEIERIYVQDFLCQRVVKQHDAMAVFHPRSLNTLRVITLRLGSQIVPVAATFRMGNGSHVDNGHAGGLLCGVDLSDARLTPFACDVVFRRHDRHPLTGVVFAGRAVPHFDAILGLAVRVHRRLPYFDMVSCDIALLESQEPCLVEANTVGQGVEPHQFLKGAPLFGEHTEEVLSMVAARVRQGWNV